MDFSPLGGDWTGSWQTWVEPNELYSSSDVEASVEVLYEDKAVLLRYSAELDGPVDGVALVGVTQHEAVAHWLDTWHTGGLVMSGVGPLPNGWPVVVAAPYSADDETWQWTTSYLLDGDRLTISHHNEGPNQARYLGVEMVLDR